MQPTKYKSTGPTSDSGKCKMRDNALKHGLTAKHVVISGETGAEYEALRIGLMESYLPATVAESILVTQIAEGYWRLMRARKVETEFWNKNIDSSHDMLTVFSQHAAELDRINRYLTTLERSYYRAIKELKQEQALRPQRLEEMAAELLQDSTPEAPAESVSQNAHAAPTTVSVTPPDDPAPAVPTNK